MRICSVDGCGRPHYGLSWCRRHWERMHKYGRLHLVHASPGMSAADILAWKSERVGACLVWTGGCSDDGYGQTTVNGVRWQTHRLAYTVHHGPIPDGEIVRHSCDNPPCMEPSHLLSGTHADNGNDKYIRRRSTYGERNAAHVLSETDVLRIDASLKQGVSGAQLARDYGVGKSTISRIRRRESWSYLFEGLDA